MPANMVNHSGTRPFQSLRITIFAVLLAACSGGESIKHETDRGYFIDALDCRALSVYKETVLLPNPTAGGAIEIPLGHDAGEFINCMAYKGRPAPLANVTEYLEVSEHCMAEARGAGNSDEIYAHCIRNSELGVELEDK